MVDKAEGEGFKVLDRRLLRDKPGPAAESAPISPLKERADVVRERMRRIGQEESLAVKRVEEKELTTPPKLANPDTRTQQAADSKTLRSRGEGKTVLMRQLGKVIEKVIKEYGRVLEEAFSEGQVHHRESELPYPKEVIREAILAVLRAYPKDRRNDEFAEHLKTGYLFLEDFLSDEEWTIVHEWERRVAEGPDSVLAMDPKKMEMAVQIIGEVGNRYKERSRDLENL